MVAMEGKCRDMSRVRIFLTHFLPALRKIKKRCFSIAQRQRAIRFAADMFLVQGSNKDKCSAWSRALNLQLMRREKTITTMKMKKSPLSRNRSIMVAKRMRLGSHHSRFGESLDIKTGGRDDHGAIERRLRILGRLVPGGRKMGVDTLLQETADYIWNIQMQVKAMAVLVDFYAANSAGRDDESVAQNQQGASCGAQI